MILLGGVYLSPVSVTLSMFTTSLGPAIFTVESEVIPNHVENNSFFNFRPILDKCSNNWLYPKEYVSLYHTWIRTPSSSLSHHYSIITLTLLGTFRSVESGRGAYTILWSGLGYTSSTNLLAPIFNQIGSVSMD